MKGWFGLRFLVGIERGIGIGRARSNLSHFPYNSSTNPILALHKPNILHGIQRKSGPVFRHFPLILDRNSLQGTPKRSLLSVKSWVKRRKYSFQLVPSNLGIFRSKKGTPMCYFGLKTSLKGIYTGDPEKSEHFLIIPSEILQNSTISH